MKTHSITTLISLLLAPTALAVSTVYIAFDSKASYSDGVNTLSLPAADAVAFTLPDGTLRDAQGNALAWGISATKVTSTLASPIDNSEITFNVVGSSGGAAGYFYASGGGREQSGPYIKITFSNLNAGSYYNLSTSLGGAQGDNTEGWVLMNTANVVNNLTSLTTNNTEEIKITQVGDTSLAQMTGRDFVSANHLDWTNIVADANGEISLYAHTVYNAHLGYTSFTLSDVASGQVPEPATVSLSLLALAGLAARRRRK